MKKKKIRMRATSSVKVHSGRQHRMDRGYLEPILCLSLFWRFHCTRHHPSVLTPTPVSDGETPAKGLISGCKAGSAVLPMELTQEQKDYDKEGKKCIYFNICSFIPSFIYSLNK